MTGLTSAEAAALLAREGANEECSLVILEWSGMKKSSLINRSMYFACLKSISSDR